MSKDYEKGSKDSGRHYLGDVAIQLLTDDGTLSVRPIIRKGENGEEYMSAGVCFTSKEDESRLRDLIMNQGM